MSKRIKIIYWIATVWLALGMFSTGLVQLLKMEDDVNRMTQLGYPIYLLNLIGVWKLLGVIAILIPKTPVLKEWAYAGFFFVMSSAAISHFAVGHPLSEIFPSLLLLILTIISWYFRPENKKVNLQNNQL